MNGNTPSGNGNWRVCSWPLDQPPYAVDRLGPGNMDRFYAEYADRRPVILTDAMRDWPALGRWTPEYFAELCGKLKVGVFQHRPRNDMSFIEQSFFSWRETGLADYVQFLRTGKLLDADGAELFPGEQWEWALRASIDILQVPTVLEGLRPGELLPPGIDYSGAFWMGPPGYVTGLHCDPMPINFLLQLYGRKRITLFSPEQAHLLYPHHTHRGAIHSAINAFEPDLERHPLLRHAVAAQGEFGPGDVFYIPPSWWHLIQAVELSITATLFVGTY